MDKKYNAIGAGGDWGFRRLILQPLKQLKNVDLLSCGITRCHHDYRMPFKLQRLNPEYKIIIPLADLLPKK